MTDNIIFAAAVGTAVQKGISFVYYETEPKLAVDALSVYNLVVYEPATWIDPSIIPLNFSLLTATGRLIIPMSSSCHFG
jgi:hypothetical protein